MLMVKIDRHGMGTATELLKVLVTTRATTEGMAGVATERWAGR